MYVCVRACLRVVRSLSTAVFGDVGSKDGRVLERRRNENTERVASSFAKRSESC